MILRSRFANLWLSQHNLPIFSLRLRSNLSFPTSSSPDKVSIYVDEKCHDFLPWLERMAGTEISSVLSIGKSACGRSLYASKPIKRGDCMLMVPYSVQLVPDNLLPEIKTLLGDDVGNVAKLALVILRERQLGQHSEWAPYISRLPRIGELQSTVFWSDDELEMIRPSPLYQETIKQIGQIENDFCVVRPVIDRFPEFFQDVTINYFKHAYSLVTSRAWESTRGLSMIPFADFLNHEGISKADVLSDESKQLSEVISDHNYAPGDEVLIRYGKFSNATLLLDFGFTLPQNIYDQVQVEVSIPHHDCLCAMKLDILHRHHTPSIKDVNEFSSSGNSFTIKHVVSASGKGRGFPQSLRAFARVLCLTSAEELNDLSMEASRNDGRLARHPLKNRSREIQAHQFLISIIARSIKEYNASIKSLDLLDTHSSMFGTLALRRQLARELLSGELRVMESAAAWLTNYCANLTDI